MNKGKKKTGAKNESAVALRNAGLTTLMAANVRRLRNDLQWSLETLAQQSGVSKAMLSQIEQARSAPSINILWKIAAALDVPFAALLSHRAEKPIAVIRRIDMKPLSSHKGDFISRALFPLDNPRRVEFYELVLAPRCKEEAEPHPPGTTENIVVSSGRLVVSIGNHTQQLQEGDSVFFLADTPHTYENPTAQKVKAYLVMTYAERRV